MAKLSQIKLGSTTYDIGAAWGNISGKPSTFPPESHTHNYAGSSSAGGSASTVAVTETTPASATTYYLHYSTGVSGSQTTRANTDLYYYDTGSSSYFNVGSSSNIGGLTLHYNNGYYVNLITDAVTANRDIKLPNASGTIALTGHTHNYAGSSSAGGAANSVKTNLTIKLNGGSTEGTNLFTFNGSTAKTINITPSAIGAATSGHNHDSTYVNVSGDTMTGNLILKGTNPYIGFANSSGTTKGYAQYIESDDTYAFGAGVANSLVITNTGSISIPASQTFTPKTSNSGSVGTSSKKWNAMYATTFHGALNGNASTSTVSTRSQYLETWYNEKDKTYGASYPLYAWWETGSECRLMVDNYTVKVNYADSAGTCTSLSTNAGSTTKAIYFTGGKPAQCNDTINHNISGYSASLAYPAQITTDANIDGFLEADRFKVGTWNSTSSPGVSNGIILSGGWTSTNYGFQIAIDDDPTYFLALRQKDSSGWKAWKRIPMADGTGASGSWNITAAASNKVNNLRSIGTSSQSHAEALASEFSTNKGNVPRNSLATYYSSSYGNGSFYQGYFLTDYDTNPYGGFYVCHYNTPYYVGIQSGSFTQFQLWKSGDAVTGAVWNDYAECRESDTQEAGYVMIENGDDTLSKSTERLQQFAGISSDTWGFSQGETEKAKTHIAVAGRVLAHPYRNRDEYKPGDAVCTAPGGTVDIMTEEEIMKYPHRIVGTVSCVPDYEEWGGGNDREPVKVNGRIWIKVR